MSFFWEGRFKEGPSELLKHCYADSLREPGFLQALHQWDKAQVVVLAEGKVAPEETIRSLVHAIAEMEKEGVVEARSALWNVVHGGEEYMRRYCTEEQAGWLHLGRSSPSLRVVAARIAFRHLQLEIMAASLELREALIELASKHTETLMPGYSFIQHLEPATFGFYLMSFVEPLERDFARLMTANKNTNVSSVGNGVGYGIEYPLDFARFDELLGFTQVPRNARDAVRNYDYMIETYMALALMHNTLGRLAMDFLIWHTAEFDFIRLPDNLSITSSVSPQMRIPYVLGFVNGTSGFITGRLMEALGTTKTASDQLEVATLLPAEFWKCADESTRVIDALVECLAGMTVNAGRMAAGANRHWSQASTLIGYLVKEKGMSFRTGHQILALLMQEISGKNLAPSDVTPEMVENAAKKYTGHEIGLTQDVLNDVFDAMYCVRQRSYRGGVAPERVAEHVISARESLEHDTDTLSRLEAEDLAARERLNTAFQKLQAEYQTVR